MKIAADRIGHTTMRIASRWHKWDATTPAAGGREWVMGSVSAGRVAGLPALERLWRSRGIFGHGINGDGGRNLLADAFGNFWDS